MRPLQLTTDQVNYLNVGLMLLAAGLAFWRPFEVFLFVYGARAGHPCGDLLAARPRLLHRREIRPPVPDRRQRSRHAVRLQRSSRHAPGVGDRADARGVRRRAGVRARAKRPRSRIRDLRRDPGVRPARGRPGRRFGVPHLPPNADPRIDLHRRLHPDRRVARPQPVGTALAAGVPGRALRPPLRSPGAGALRRVALRAERLRIPKDGRHVHGWLHRAESPAPDHLQPA